VHTANASTTAADTPLLPNNIIARTTAANLYKAAATNLVALNAGSVTNVGGSQAHLNMQPFLTLSFCIALQGIFPSPN
jgi:microcystin-dependent protein